MRICLCYAALVYLVDNYHADTVKWPVVPATVDNAPAPWWTYDGDIAQPSNRAEIPGYLYEYPDLFSTHAPASERSVMVYLLSQPIA